MVGSEEEVMDVGQTVREDLEGWASDFEVDRQQPTLREDLEGWAGDFGVTHMSVDALLKVLRRHGHKDLPSTARTLLTSRKSFQVETVGGVDTIKYNIAEQLSLHLNKYPPETIQELQSIDLSLNVDGLPLFKSSAKTLWPILCAINLTPKCIFPLSLAIASSKPKDITFIGDVANELAQVMEDGLEWAGRTVKVNIRCITCDAPAKAMVRCVKLYSGYYGCDKCTQRGVWDGRMLYPDVTDLTLRTDQSFRGSCQPEHHQPEKTSPFSSLPIDMVKAFPADYMHQCCLGVMKKLLLLWTKGKSNVRLSRAQMAEVNSRLKALRPAVPSCFARRPRGLNELDHWKATEFRQFALYTGKLVLRGVLHPDLFKHFMTFSTALCILVSPHLATFHSRYAHDLLTFFVDHGAVLYGPKFHVYNVHSLLHLVADVNTFGCLDNFSAFPFESKLYQIKRQVRSGKSPLVEIANRLEERSQLKIPPTAAVQLNLKKGAVFTLNNEECCEVVSTREDETVMCRVYTHLQPYMMEPCDSRIYGTYHATIRSSEMRIIAKSKLERTAFIVEEPHGYRIVVTVLHSL